MYTVIFVSMWVILDLFPCWFPLKYQLMIFLMLACFQVESVGCLSGCPDGFRSKVSALLCCHQVQPGGYVIMDSNHLLRVKRHEAVDPSGILFTLLVIFMNNIMYVHTQF